MKLRLTCALVAALLTAPAMAQTKAKAVNIVAAENFYGDIARQLAGPDATITSILANPDEDPHLFEASASVARSLADAGIVVYNGVDYDPWMTKLLSASPSKARRVIVAGDLLGRKAGVNPHLWYDPPTAPAVAKAIAAALVAENPAGKAGYERRLHFFIASLEPIASEVARMHAKYAGTPVTATEPVFGYMAAALGFKMRNEGFQLSTMNDTEPSASDVAAFENDLKSKQVRLFFYNRQATDSSAQRLLALAKSNGIPVVGVTETMPKGKTFQAWMHDELDAVDKALSGKAS